MYNKHKHNVFIQLLGITEYELQNKYLKYEH